MAKENPKRLFITEGEVELMKKFRLDELDIRILKAKGKTPQEVAGELGILPMQAEARMKSIFLKLGVRTFKEARKKFEEELKN